MPTKKQLEEADFMRVNGGPRAQDIHPVPVRQFEQQSQQPPVVDPVQTAVRNMEERRARDLTKKTLEAAELELDEDMTDKKYRIRKRQLEMEQLEEELKARENAQNVAEMPQQVTNDSMDPQIAQLLIDLPEDKRAAFMNSYMMMQMAKGGGQNMGLMPMLLMAQGQTKPQTNTSDLLTALKMGIDLKGSDSEMSKLLMQHFLTTSGGQKENAFDVLIRARDAGLVFSPADMAKLTSNVPAPVPQGPSATEVQQYGITKEHELKMKELELQRDLKMGELDVEKEKAQQLNSVLTTGITTLGGFLAEGEAKKLADMGKTYGGMPPGSPVGAVAHEACPHCGTQLTIPQPEIARNLTCPNCKATDCAKCKAGEVITWNPAGAA